VALFFLSPGIDWAAGQDDQQHQGSPSSASTALPTAIR